MRSRTLARRWGVDPRAMTELCLVAVKTGLLAMSWDVLCPRCRGAKAAAGSLDQLPSGVHCPSCNISYDREFAYNVELTFRPNAAIRAVGDGAYCLSGPMTTPHVIVQLVLEAGERREVGATLEPGAYRLRTLEPGGETDIEFAAGGFPALIGDGATVVPGPPAPPDTVVMENRSARQAVLLIEDRTWIADALTAHEATTLQAFRDMFSDEVLRPGDDVSVGHVSLLFTDIKGSTAYDEAVGDGHAYHVVRDHFAYLGEAVRRHDGAIIKTIGDAVMAAFARPTDAVAAALDVQRNIAAFNRDEGGEHVILKIGLHAGGCIAVNLNGRLDYFGSTVNMAARLQGESVGDDIVLSEALSGDAGVVGLIADCDVARESASLKGFDQPVSFMRVTARAFGGG